MIDRVRRVSGLLLLFVCVRLADSGPAGAQSTASTQTPVQNQEEPQAPAQTQPQAPAQTPAQASTQPPATVPDPPPIAAPKFSRLQREGTSELSVYDSRSRAPIHGFLLRLTERDLTMLVNGREETIPLASVRRIDRRGDSVWNGFAIGAAVGVFTWIKIYRSGIPSDSIAWVVGIPALIGAGIDALSVGETTVYRASSSARADARGPAVRGSRRWPRVMFTVRF